MRRPASNHTPQCTLRHFSAHLNAFRRLWRSLSALRALAALIALLTLAHAAPPDLGRLAMLAEARYGPVARQQVEAWQALLNAARDLGEREKLDAVNDFFNLRLRFTDDLELWQLPDYWATPLETLGRGAGDCEDFSIAKYMTLKALGVDPSRMRLIYVRARVGGPASHIVQAHMVVGYYATPTAEPLVLDNLIGEIRPASRRPDLFPVFSFNGEGLWVGGAGRSSADPTERLSRWRDLLARMRDDGLE